MNQNRTRNPHYFYNFLEHNEKNNEVMERSHKVSILKKLYDAAVYFLSAIIIILLFIPDGFAQSRIKDIVSFEGVRSNQLLGYGLVVGLDGTGDRMRNSPFTEQSIQGMLDRLGVGLRDADLRTRNVAAVMVTAQLPPFARKGSNIDVVVSSMGDATDLQGGTLVITPLLGADGDVYAVAQGPISVTGFSVQGQNGSMSEGVPTTARLTGGAIVEQELDFDLREMGRVRLALYEPDFTTASRIADAINRDFGRNIAEMLDPGGVEVVSPADYAGSIPRLIADLENIPVIPASKARVVVDSKTGTIVIGENVMIDRVAVSQGGLTVRIQEEEEVLQPDPFSLGETATENETNINVDEKEVDFVVMGGAVSLQELVDSLNATGVGAREVISILQAIKRAGALHAELEVI